MICLLNLYLWKMGDRNSQTKDAPASCCRKVRERCLRRAIRRSHYV
ncbi:MAG: hypothetical protein ACYTX0_29560 [Nostoc sp.]